MSSIELQDYGYIFHGRRDHYFVEGSLKESLISNVYLASVINDGSGMLDGGLEVAVKQIDPAFKRLEREAVAQILIQQGGGHENILSAYEFIKEEEAVVFPYLKSGTLKELQGRIGKFNPQQALSIILPICGAVEYLHSLGIVHRDIKSDNVLLQADEGEMPVSDKVLPVLDLSFITPKLYDFDLSWHELTSHFDESDIVCGTLNYMAPEVWTYGGERTGKLRDIYALGVVLYELLAGVSPFARNHDNRTIQAHMWGDYTDVRIHNDAVSPSLSYVIDKALARKTKRHQSAAELKEELKMISDKELAM